MSRSDRGLVPGTVDLVILQTLTDGPRHGFALSRAIAERSDGVLRLQDAALYQALHRMEGSGWLSAEWGVSDKGRRARFYRLTEKGRRQLRKEIGFWERYATAVYKLLGTAGEGA